MRQENDIRETLQRFTVIFASLLMFLAFVSGLVVSYLETAAVYEGIERTNSKLDDLSKKEPSKPISPDEALRLVTNCEVSSIIRTTHNVEIKNSTNGLFSLPSINYDGLVEAARASGQYHDPESTKCKPIYIKDKIKNIPDYSYITTTQVKKFLDTCKLGLVALDYTSFDLGQYILVNGGNITNPNSKTDFIHESAGLWYDHLIVTNPTYTQTLLSAVANAREKCPGFKDYTYKDKRTIDYYPDQLNYPPKPKNGN